MHAWHLKARRDYNQSPKGTLAQKLGGGFLPKRFKITHGKVTNSLKKRANIFHFGYQYKPQGKLTGYIFEMIFGVEQRID